MTDALAALLAEIESAPRLQAVGRVRGVAAGAVQVSGLPDVARLGDHLSVDLRGGGTLVAEIVGISDGIVTGLPHEPPTGVAMGDTVVHLGPADRIAPGDGWIGRVIDPYGRPLDGAPLLRGVVERPLMAAPPGAGHRRGLGARLETGIAAFNTFLPVVRGQRIGLFAGSGVGKSRLLAALCQRMQADVVVLALIGERGREVRQFTRDVLGPEGMARSVVVAATSDQSPLVRRRCAWAAMAVAEHFRDQGRNVLFLADSVTRFAEAHRDIALAGGEMPAQRGFPASIGQMITALCERAGPGGDGQGDITGVFSVLVAGSDMEEPVADTLRGVLDGHVVLDRAIAERGRFPAINLSRSVSRSLPEAATAAENTMLSEARQLIAAYESAEPMIRAGLYAEGSDPVLDRAMRVHGELDAFLARGDERSIAAGFERLALILRRAGPGPQRPTGEAKGQQVTRR